MRVHIGNYPHDRRKKRKVQVRINKWDTWNLEDTLALIIHPALIQLKATKHGTPFTEASDGPPVTDEVFDGISDGYSEQRWNWIMDEMIFAFGELVKGDWDAQFHSGHIDIDWVEEPEKFGGESFFKMTKGPNDTHVFDEVGYRAHQERMQNGFRLFGRYYQNLWD